MDFATAKEVDPDYKDIEQKLKHAQQETKKAAKKKDFYEVLGLQKGASDKDIRNAYRKMALKYHPDRNNESDEQKEAASKKFKEVNEANDVLSDPKKKAAFDNGASADDINNGHGGMGGGFDMGGMGGFGGMDPNDLIKMMFMQGGMGGMPGGGRGGGRGRGRGGGNMGGMGGFPAGFNINDLGGMPGMGRGGGFNF